MDENMREWILQNTERNDARVFLEVLVWDASTGRVQQIKSGNSTVYVISEEHFKKLEKVLS